MAYGAKIAKNAAWLMFATTAQKVVAFLAFTVVARLIGSEQVGIYFYSISITSIFVTFADLGMTPVVIRAVAGKRDDDAHLLGATLRSKIILIPLAVFGALLYAMLFRADATILTTVAIACLVMSLDTVQLVLYGALRGKQNLRPEAIGMFVGQILTGIASVGAALFHFGPVGLAVALLLGSTWNVVWSYIQLHRFEIRIMKPRQSDYWKLAKEALPFGIAGIAVKVYSYVDSLFIQQYNGSSAVGLYAVAYKLTYALQFLPLTFTAALYPALASAYANKEERELRNTFLGSLRLMAAVSFPMAAGLSALASRIIPLVYGKGYVGSISVLEILPWVLIPIFLDFPTGSLLNATHRAHLKTASMVATMFLNIMLNAILVPAYGPVGAAWAGVGSFWMLYFIGIWFAREHTRGLGWITWFTLRSVIAAGVTWVAFRTLGGFMVLPAAVLFGGSVAVIMSFVVGFVTVEDVYRFLRRTKTAPQNVADLHD